MENQLWPNILEFRELKFGIYCLYELRDTY